MDPAITRDWTDQLANSVRPVVTFVVTGVFAYLALTGKLSGEGVMGVIGSVLTFWFVQRQQTASTAATTAAVVAATSGTKPVAPPPTG